MRIQKKTLLLFFISSCSIIIFSGNLRTWVFSLKPNTDYWRSHKNKSIRHTVNAAAGILSEVDSIYGKLTSYEPLFVPPDFNCITSARNSRYFIINPSDTYRTGDILTVYVQTYNHLGSKIAFGGDFFRARIFSNHLNASSSGTVLDLKNGTYLISFQLFWAGEVSISIKLMHSGQAVSLIRQGREQYPHKISFKGIFQSNGKEEITDCHFNLTSPGPLCDFSEKKAGVMWFCEKPKSLGCDNLKYLYSYSNINFALSKEEEQVLDSKNIGEDLVPLGKSSVMVQKKEFNIDVPPCVPRPYVPKNITGFVLNNAWTSTQCSAQNFASPDMAAKCLSRKKVYLLGDSTARQWWEYLISFIPTLKAFNFVGKEKNFEHLAVDLSHNIYLRWTAHGAPFTSTSKYPYTNLHPVSQEIDHLFGGKDYIVVVGLGAHFTAFPLRLFIQRLLSIRSALQRLLARNPETTVILKNVNTRDVNSFVMANSDCLSFEFNRAINEVFQNMNVALVDAWDITVAFNSFRIHPTTSVVKSKVDLFLSHVCPKFQ